MLGHASLPASVNGSVCFSFTIKNVLLRFFNDTSTPVQTLHRDCYPSMLSGNRFLHGQTFCCSESDLCSVPVPGIKATKDELFVSKF